MKLGLLTYDIARDWDLEKLIGVSRRFGFAGIEFRVDKGHKHGVELDKNQRARREIREKIQDAYLEVIGIGTSNRFEYSDKNLRRDNIESTKKYIELAADIGAVNVRVFGNEFEPGADKMETIKWVGEALAELIEFSKAYNVNVLFEMHGDFNYWKYALKALEYSACEDTGVIFNCDDRDLVRNSVKNTYSRVRHLIRHVHIHSFLYQYPYKELMQLLKDDEYTGYLSAEIEEATADPETVLAYYSMLYYEMLSNLK